MADDPEQEAFRAKLKQGSGRGPVAHPAARSARVDWSIVVPVGAFFVVVVGVWGGLVFHEQAHKAELIAEGLAHAREEAAHRAAAQEERERASAAVDRVYAEIGKEAAKLTTSAPQGDVTAAKGRKVLALDAGAASVHDRDAQRSGGVFAASPAEVGVIVTVAFETDMAHVVEYEGGGKLAPYSFRYAAYTWPEKQLIATWVHTRVPPKSMRMRRLGSFEMPVDAEMVPSHFKEDVALLVTGVAPRSTP